MNMIHTVSRNVIPRRGSAKRSPSNPRFALHGRICCSSKVAAATAKGPQLS